MPLAKTKVGNSEGIGSCVYDSVIIVVGEKTISNLPSGSGTILSP